MTGFFISETGSLVYISHGRYLSSGDLRANALDLCALLLLSVWTKLVEADVTDQRSLKCFLHVMTKVWRLEADARSMLQRNLNFKNDYWFL